MKAVIRFKDLPGRRFEVKDAAPYDGGVVDASFCGSKEKPVSCALFCMACDEIKGALEICEQGYFFEEAPCDD